MAFSHLPHVEHVLSKLDGVKGREGSWTALCPAHDDRANSLSIGVGKKDRAVMLNCHAGCPTAIIVGALGLRMADLWPDDAQRPSRPASNGKVMAQGVEARQRLVKSYDYTDANGTLLFQVCRMEPKGFPQRRPDGAGNWVWGLGDVQPVLYRLPLLIEAAAEGKRIFFVEGEKDVETLEEIGYIATTSPMGAGKWREYYAPTLKGADVVILPDNDDKGRQHAEQVAASLHAQGCTVKVVPLPGVKEKGDISDWLDAGHDVDELEELIARAGHWPLGSSTEAKRTRWKLSEIWNNESIMRPPPPVVPYLAWSARSTLLAAREKSGKSTLTGYMSTCVSLGSEFLGEPCDRGRVLIVGLEEFIGDTARRLKQFGADGNMIELVTSLASAPDDRPSEVRAHVEAVAPSLVILDSLIAYSNGMVTNASDSAQMGPLVQSLTNIAHETGAALVIIHHAKKADGKYRDSSAIGGAVDIIAEVFQPDENTDPTRRRVRAVGRVPARGIDFRFTGTHYERCDTDGPLRAPLDQRIEAVVRERPGITANDVVRAVEESRERVLERIKLMIANGRILNDGSFQYMRLRTPAYAPGSSLL